MATDLPEGDLPRTGERGAPQIGADIEMEHSDHSQGARALQGEIEVRDLKLAELSQAAKKREEELRTELARQSTHFREGISRLQRQLEDQMTQSAECVRELKREIEHLKITRFEAKRECHGIKTSLSWRLTWPLRALRDAGVALIGKSQQRLFSGSRASSARVGADARSVEDRSPSTDPGAGYHEPQPGGGQQSVEPRFVEGLSSLNRDKETVLLVTHDLSRTGAPILVLNLAAILRRKYNVIVLALRDGDLGNEFLAGSDRVIGPLSAEQRSPHFLTALFREIAARATLKFAIVNSIGSGIALSALWENDIAIVHLIHEFSSYIRPPGQFRSSAFYSGARIFPAEVVRENARHELPERTDPGRIVPTGKCETPSRAEPGEHERILFDLRPPGWPADTVVILGVGTITLRKGVDMFIACAKRVAEMAPGKRFRFVWFGDPLDSEADRKYSLYLADQVERSGLNEVAVIRPAISDVDVAHSESDLMFVTSRLDPLPSVSLDALFHAKPVVCFKAATGTAEYLERDPVASYGIVPFLDVEAAARRIVCLIEDSDLRLRVGQASRKLARSYFSLEHYVEELDGIGQECAFKKQQEKADRLVISRSNLFDVGFFSRPLDSQISRDPIRHYISAYSSGIRPRKALPGFHPGIYEERNDTKGRDPLAHYLDSGRPSGPWSFEVIRERTEAPRARQSLRVGLHLHLYYHEMSNEIFDHLLGINGRIDLLISVANRSAAKAVEQVFSGYSQGAIDIRVFENCGRDIGPFLTGFGEVILDRYDIIGHLHAKKSAGMGTSAKSLTPAFLESIALWRRFLYANLLGGTHAIADTIIERISGDESIGLVFPDDPHVLGWGKNLPYALDLAKRLRIAEPPPKTTFNFPVGSMFWARTAALRPLLELGLTWDDYPKEPVSYDGSLLHAIERILPFVAESAGFRNAVTYVAGFTR